MSGWERFYSASKSPFPGVVHVGFTDFKGGGIADLTVAAGPHFKVFCRITGVELFSGLIEETLSGGVSIG